MRQLHLVTASQRRGAEVFARDLCETLAKSSDDAVTLTALTAGPEGNPLGATILGRRALAPATLLALRRAAREADVVVAHGSTTLPAGVLALTGTKVPLVYRNIGDPTVWSGQGFRRMRVAALLRRTRHVVAVWPGAAETLATVHGVDRSRLTVIPNAVAADAHGPASEAARTAARVGFELPEDQPVVACVGALSPEKDVATALAALAELDDVHLLVVGDGPERAALERAAADQVHFTGILPDPSAAFAAADAVVLTSRTEGMPGVLVEAGLCGLPAVASDVGGVREIVRDGETGRLVRPGDVAGFTRALQEVLADAPSLGAAARKRCEENFTLDVVAPQWADVLAKVTGGDG